MDEKHSGEDCRGTGGGQARESAAHGPGIFSRSGLCHFVSRLVRARRTSERAAAGGDATEVHEEKSTYKWEYLLDASKPQVFTEWTIVDTKQYAWLKGACEASLEQYSGDKYWLPYACVAMAGEYGGNGELTLADLRAKARVVQDGIESTKKELAKAERAYKRLRKKITGKRASKPSYGRGKRRKEFKNAEDKHLYRECFRLHDELASWERKKTALIKALFFFGITLQPGEDPSINPGEFI